MKKFFKIVWEVMEEISAARAQRRIKYGWY